jgi:hypothetical protein
MYPYEGGLLLLIRAMILGVTAGLAGVDEL